MQWLSNEEKYRGMLPYLSQTMDNLQDIKETDKKVKTESKTMKVEDNPKPTDNM